jgi:hypothetical protein
MTPEQLAPGRGVGHVLLEGHDHGRCQDCTISALVDALERMLAVYYELMPGIRHIAVQRYDEVNDAPMAARRVIGRARGNAP